MSLTLVLSICLCVLSVIGNSSAEQQQNTCEAATDCKACLEAAGQCKWCSDPDYNKKDARLPRCSTPKKLKENMCREKNIQIQNGKVWTVPNHFGPVTQVTPKGVSLTLRPGETQRFKLSVKPAENYPVRLYYLMDMSYSMEDDLQSLKTLGNKIAKEINNITNNFQLAFGTFVDKTVTPFIQLESKDKPCANCEPTFGYKHIFDFNMDASKFEEAVATQKISGNLDTPEGGFDALMQVAVCGDKIWPKDDEISRRIVVFVTDATPHIAGDGKIGGITVPNDGQCHLTTSNGGTHMMYSKTNEMDYPSISFLRAKLKENRIVPIIAITEDVEPIYRQLQEAWNDLGTGLGPLEKDSSNIVDLIRDNYKKISTTVRLTDNSPGHLVVKYKVIGGCTYSTKDNECTDVAINQKVDFQIQVTATDCPVNWKAGDMFKITVPGFGDVDIDVQYICECDCAKSGNGEQRSARCNGTGTFQCGICNCEKRRFGKQCECDSESQADTSLCIMPNYTDKAICSGFGTCVCGKCECNEQSDKTKKISGTYCQCNNFGCDRYGGKICGGPERGQCKCGSCACKDAYQGENCGQKNCTLGMKKCKKDDGKVCSGNGRCNCDTCECDIGYSGMHCEKCVSCAGKCKNNEKCVLCQSPYNIGEESECDKCSLQISLVNNTSSNEFGQKKCSVYLNETCRVFFSFHSVSNDNETVYVEHEPRCVVIIPADAPILFIVVGIIGGIVLVGLLLLLVWKLIVTAHDKREFRKFEKDRMKSKWENAENPIYRPSQQQFQNPAYHGNK